VARDALEGRLNHLGARTAPGLERRDRRTRKGVPVNDDELVSRPERGVAYPVGSLWLRFE
jgi:hypothetical protein